MENRGDGTKSSPFKIPYINPVNTPTGRRKKAAGPQPLGRLGIWTAAKPHYHMPPPPQLSTSEENSNIAHNLYWLRQTHPRRHALHQDTRDPLGISTVPTTVRSVSSHPCPTSLRGDSQATPPPVARWVAPPIRRDRSACSEGCSPANDNTWRSADSA